MCVVVCVQVSIPTSSKAFDPATPVRPSALPEPKRVRLNTPTPQRLVPPLPPLVGHVVSRWMTETRETSLFVFVRRYWICFQYKR